MPCRDCLDRQLAPLCLLRLEPTLASACLAMPCRDCLDRQLFEERMLEVGREVARNEFPDVILLQASLWPAFMLLLL